MSNTRRYKPTIELTESDIEKTFDKSIQIHNSKQPFYSSDILLPNGEYVTVFSCPLQSNGYSAIRRSMKDSELWISGLERYKAAIMSAEMLRLWESSNLRLSLDSIGNKHPIIVAIDMNGFSKSKCFNTLQDNSLLDA